MIDPYGPGAEAHFAIGKPFSALTKAGHEMTTESPSQRLRTLERARARFAALRSVCARHCGNAPHVLTAIDDFERAFEALARRDWATGDHAGGGCPCCGGTLELLRNFTWGTRFCKECYAETHKASCRAYLWLEGHDPRQYPELIDRPQ